MKVSIVIPLYNKAPFIGRTLDSVLRQSFSDYEIIVVDDGSSDAGPELVAAYRDPRVALIRQENAGPAKARNRGLAAARGEYIVFLDADDEWLADFLSATVAGLDASPPTVVAAATGYLQYPGGQSQRPLWLKRGLRNGIVTLAPNTQAGYAVSVLAYMSPWNTLLRTDAVRRAGGFCSKGKCLYGEDSFLWTKLLLNGSLLVLLRELACYHTECSNLAMHRKRQRPIEPMLLFPDDLYAACPPDLRTLLRNILAVRAAKTALMLSYFGNWRQGRELLGSFCSPGTLMLPQVAMARAAANPLGSAFGWACRKAV